MQIMRFDVTPLPPDQTARPFDLSQQVLLNTAMRADYAATVVPLPPPPPTAPIREVSEPAATGLIVNRAGCSLVSACVAYIACKLAGTAPLAGLQTQPLLLHNGMHRIGKATAVETCRQVLLRCIAGALLKHCSAPLDPHSTDPGNGAVLLQQLHTMTLPGSGDALIT